jgi:hypothetical protein
LAAGVVTDSGAVGAATGVAGLAGEACGSEAPVTAALAPAALVVRSFDPDSSWVSSCCVGVVSTAALGSLCTRAGAAVLLGAPAAGAAFVPLGGACPGVELGLARGAGSSIEPWRDGAGCAAAGAGAVAVAGTEAAGAGRRPGSIKNTGGGGAV